MANRVEIEFLIKTENEKIRALEADMRGLSRTVQKVSIENGRLTKEQKMVAASAKHAAAEAKAQSRERLADLQLELNMQKRRKMANLGVGLSMLFAGQALRRFSEGALRSLVNTYMEVNGQTSTFGIMTNRLIASWEFLKWSIMNALAETGVLDFVISSVMSLVGWFTSLSDTSKSAIGIILLGMLLLGVIISPLGQIITAMSADWTMMGTNIARVVKSPILAWGGAIMVAAVASWWLFTLWKDDGPVLEKIVTSIGIGLLAAGAGALFFGSALALPLIALGAAILLGIALKQEMGIAFSYLVQGLIVIGNYILKFLVTPLEVAFKIFSALTKKKDAKTKSSPFDRIDKITGAAAEGNYERRRQLQADKAARSSPLDNLGLGGVFGTSGAATAATQSPAAPAGGTSSGGITNVINLQNAYIDQTSAAMANATQSFNDTWLGTPRRG